MLHIYSYRICYVFLNKTNFIMATISFSTTFDLTLSPIQAIFTDTSDYSGQAIPLANVVGSFTITAPSGVVIYNNTDITNAGCDIDIVNSLVSQQIITLPLDSFLLPEIGNYTIVYRVWNSALSVFYTITNVVNYQYVAPEICINQRIDCISPLFSSVDATDYTVNGIIPAIVGTHTLDYPFGSAGEGVPTILPFTAEASVIAVSIFYQGTQTTEIVAGLTYTIITGVNSFIVIDSISGKREIKVDCAYICSILCCIRTYEKIKESFRNTNAVKFREYDEVFHEIMSYVGLMQFSIECGLGDEVCDYLQKIKILSNCSDACKCSSENASRVIGLGYLIGPAGPAGPQGNQGASGNNGNYVTVTAEAPGVNCVNGGQKVILYNGITNLPISTSYICNGVPPTIDFVIESTDNSPAVRFVVAAATNNQTVTGSTGLVAVSGTYFIIYEADCLTTGAAVDCHFNLNKTGAIPISDTRELRALAISSGTIYKIVCTTVAVLIAGDLVNLIIDNFGGLFVVNGKSIIMIKIA